MAGNRQKRKSLWVCIFLVYLGMLFYVLFFASGYDRTLVRSEYHYNLEPFREIRRFYEYRGSLGLLPVFLNLAGNIVGFMPFGWLLPHISERSDHIAIVILLGAELSLIIEILQFFGRVGSFDVDDILLNTLGAAAGYIVYYLYRQWRKNKDE